MKYKSITNYEGPFADPYFNEQLWHYFTQVWHADADYKILVSDRMIALNDCMIYYWKRPENMRADPDFILSKTVLLLDAAYCAQFYIRRGRFPKILLCDDIVSTGQEIIDFLNEFKQSVKAFLCEQNISAVSLDLDLRNSVSIYTFAYEKGNGFTIPRGAFRFYSVVSLSSAALHKLSLELSAGLAEAGAVCPSCSVSFKLNVRQTRTLYKHGMLNHNETVLSDLYLKKYGSGITGTIRIYPSRFGCTAVNTLILNHFCFEKTLSGGMIKQIQNHYPVLYRMFIESNSEKSKVELLIFMLSVINISDFYRQFLLEGESSLYKIIMSGNISRLIAGFNGGRDFRTDVLRFVKGVCNDDLRTQVSSMFLPAEPFCHCSVNSQEAMILNTAVSEKQLFHASMKNDSKAAIRLGDVFTDEPGGYLTAFRMLDCGFIDSCIAINKKGTFDTVLKINDRTPFLLLNKISVFIPAFAKAEKFYGENYKQPADTVSAFIDFISEYCQAHETNRYTAEAVEILMEVKESILQIYNSGSRFGNYNFNFEMPKRYSVSTGFNSREKWAMQRHFLYLVSLFIDGSFR